jgi:hypothetical protein
MSLHSLANHLQSAGRGEDKVLVHMTPKEVSGLQSLAMAHGGSLTINPETGLPEAGFLSRLLPTIIGAGLSIASGGTLTPLMAAGITGAGYGIAKGSLKEGLMAGFGAYGGAGLASGLSAAGAAAGTAGANAGTTAAGLADDVVLANADDIAAAKLGNATTNANLGSSYTGTKAAIDTTKAATNTGGFNAYSPASPFANTAGTNVNTMANQYANITPPSTPSTMTYTASSNPFDYTSKLAKIQNDPLMEAQLGAKATISPPSYMDKVGAGFRDVTSSGTKAWNFVKEHPAPFIGLGINALQTSQEQQAKDAAAAAAARKGSPGMIRPFEMSVAQNQSAYAPSDSTAERQFFEQPRYRELTPYAAKEGGLMGLDKYAVGGPVEQMSAQNAVGANTGYPMAHLQTPVYANPMMQRPMPNDVISAGIDAPTDRYTGEPTMGMAVGGMAGGGYNLGGYSDGGRLLRGPGDGVSDSIPASIGDRQPARLADGEFVVPARIVSEIGNGSTEAGARKLYAMMDRVQKARRKTVGKDKIAVNTKADKLLPV